MSDRSNRDAPRVKNDHEKKDGKARFGQGQFESQDADESDSDDSDRNDNRPPIIEEVKEDRPPQQHAPEIRRN